MTDNKKDDEDIIRWWTNFSEEEKKDFIKQLVKAFENIKEEESLK